jgi:micrococcal nuclease
VDVVSLYTYRGRLIRVIDGDTIEVDIDLGFNVLLGQRKLRLDGLDTPEIKTPAGVYAKQVTKDWLAENTEIKKKLTESISYVTFETLSDKPDKYGRILARVYGKDGATLNKYLVERGIAKPYDGGKRA